MSLDPTQVRNWFLLIIAAAAVLGPAYKWNMVKAQEAGRKAAVEEMAPAVEELGEIKELLQRQEDMALIERCEVRADRRGEDPDDYELECKRESDKRWAYWICKNKTLPDELLAKCGVKP